MAHTLIVTEKPSSARYIAQALADEKPKKRKRDDNSKAVWYEFEMNGKKHVAAPAVGHLFTLKQEGKGWTYPVFSAKWMPSFKANRSSKFSEPYFRNMEKLAEGADDVIVATDYDEEGEVIGYNILRFICGRKQADRMRFSTMTKTELIESYENTEKINKKLVEAGIARHHLDFAWGINITRALTLAIKNAAKRFKILSTGRVQGPVLHMLSKHERKIKGFKPEPYWEIEIEVEKGKDKFNAGYKKKKLWDEGDVDSIVKSVGKKAVVEKIETRTVNQKPPKPYNTTSLLSDIYRYFGYTPKQGLNIAESLYQRGIISYPRTSSEKLPKDIGYAKIIGRLGKQKPYKKDAEKLLDKKDLEPRQGKKDDPAHPAIYPTGEAKRIGSKQKKVYDLIVRRFLATFGESAERESQKITLDANGNKFYLKGKRTTKPGWLDLYGKYSKREDVILPKIEKGDELEIKKTNKIDKKTQPPSRFSQGSVMKEMEQRGLATKATRAQILQILFDRGYLIGNSIEVTQLGLQLNDILKRNVPDVISEKLTRRFDKMTDRILAGDTTKDRVVEEAHKKIGKICKDFKKKEEKIGKELTEAVIATQDKQSILGKCRECGGTLKVHKNWRTKKRFVGCTGYKDGCRTGFPLPHQGVISSTDRVCEECNTPKVHVRMAGKRPFQMCLDPECPTKEDWLDKKKLKKVQKKSRAASKAAEKFKCGECGRSFTSKRGLSLHERVHKKDA